MECVVFGHNDYTYAVNERILVRIKTELLLRDATPELLELLRGRMLWGVHYKRIIDEFGKDIDITEEGIWAFDHLSIERRISWHKGDFPDEGKYDLIINNAIQAYKESLPMSHATLFGFNTLQLNKLAQAMGETDGYLVLQQGEATKAAVARLVAPRGYKPGYERVLVSTDDVVGVIMPINTDDIDPE